MSKRKHLLRLLNKFARSIDADIKVLEGYITESDIIGKEVFVDLNNLHAEDDEVHLQAMRELGYLIDINLYTYSFLHEIGHIMSASKYYQILPFLRSYMKKVERLEVSDLEPLPMAREYKQLQLERDADEYAYQYFLHNYEKVKELDSEITKLLEKNSKNYLM